VPFRVAANAALAPDLIRAAMQGQVNNIGFRFAEPAQIRPRRRGLAAGAGDGGDGRKAGYGSPAAMATTLSSSRGSTRSTCRSSTPSRRTRHRRPRHRQPDSRHRSGGTFPAPRRGSTSRTSPARIATRSVPVNMAFAAASGRGGQAGGGDPARRNIIGRFQARLQRSAGAGSWTTGCWRPPRRRHRYNGPADVPMS
jgi:translocation and assembly module TamB